MRPHSPYPSPPPPIFRHHLAAHPQYLHIIEDKPVFPVIYDSKGTVLSLPPIINGHHSRITLNTKNVFIECTATDLVRRRPSTTALALSLPAARTAAHCTAAHRTAPPLACQTKAKIVLDMIVCMFAEYCAKPFEVEPVTVTNPDGAEVIYPVRAVLERAADKWSQNSPLFPVSSPTPPARRSHAAHQPNSPNSPAPAPVLSPAQTLAVRDDEARAADIYKRMGIKKEQADPSQLASLLTRMQLTATLQADGDNIAVKVPPTRPGADLAAGSPPLPPPLQECPSARRPAAGRTSMA